MALPTPDPKESGLTLVPVKVGSPNCSDGSHWGRPSSMYSYIMKGLSGDDKKYPEACEPWYHKNFMVDTIKLNTLITGDGSINILGTITAEGIITSAEEVIADGITLTTRKPFDISHPTKENHRLRHVCLEGPESAVYVRGRLTGNNVIELPDYWRGLVDPESITVSLTQIGSSQDLIVERIEWGSKVVVRSGTASNIDCYYLIHGERKDGEKLIVEYEGDKISDYPGDNRLYTHNK